MAYASHDKTLRNQGSWSLAGIWNHSWSATVCDMRDRSNIFACLQDFFLTGAADELLLQPSFRGRDQPAASPGCQMAEEGGFAHTSRTCGILVKAQWGPALLQKEVLNALIVTTGLGAWKAWAFQQLCPDTWSSQHPLGWEHPESQGKSYSWDWKSATLFYVSQTLQRMDWLKQWGRMSSSSNHISRGGRHRGYPDRLVRVVGATLWALVLGGWKGAGTSRKDHHFSPPPPFPTLIPEKGRCSPGLWEQPRQDCGKQA